MDDVSVADLSPFCLFVHSFLSSELFVIWAMMINDDHIIHHWSQSTSTDIHSMFGCSDHYLKPPQWFHGTIRQPSHSGNWQRPRWAHWQSRCFIRLQSDNHISYSYCYAMLSCYAHWHVCNVMYDVWFMVLIVGYNIYSGDGEIYIYVYVNIVVNITIYIYEYIYIYIYEYIYISILIIIDW